MQEFGSLGSHALVKVKWKIKAFREGQNYTEACSCDVLPYYYLVSFILVLNLHIAFSALNSVS